MAITWPFGAAQSISRMALENAAFAAQLVCLNVIITNKTNKGYIARLVQQRQLSDNDLLPQVRKIIKSALVWPFYESCWQHVSRLCLWSKA